MLQAELDLLGRDNVTPSDSNIGLESGPLILHDPAGHSAEIWAWGRSIQVSPQLRTIGR
jgi:hypothetical protein